MARWIGHVPANDDFGDPITDEFIDGVEKGTRRWAMMTPKSFKLRGVGLGLGKGQRYKRSVDGEWPKVEG